MCCCAELNQGICLKRSSVLHLQITLHNHFLLPTHSSQAALCAKAEKSTNRGVQSTLGLSTGPYSSSPQCSSLNLPYWHLDGFILKFRNIPPLQCVGSIWMLIPFFIGALMTNCINALPRVQKVKHAGFTFVWRLRETATPLASVLLHKEEGAGARVMHKRAPSSRAVKFWGFFLSKRVLKFTVEILPLQGNARSSEDQRRMGAGF